MFHQNDIDCLLPKVHKMKNKITKLNSYRITKLFYEGRMFRQTGNYLNFKYENIIYEGSYGQFRVWG